MIIGTGYLLRASELMHDLITHGWGEMTFKVTSLKDNGVKVEVLCGKSYVYFIKKTMQFDDSKIL